jgi:uncharacterized membrane protein
MSRLSIFAALAAGAALMYELDPAQGRRRRARLRDETDHFTKITARGMQRGLDDASHRIHGLWLKARAGRKTQIVDDAVLSERVRSCLGHYCSHPHAVQVSATQGIVELKGPILADEVYALVSHVRRVPGVRGIIDHLEMHDSPGDVPSLQGGRRYRRDGALGRPWLPSVRLGVGVAGALMVLGGVRRGGVGGVGLALLGGAALARAASNLDFSSMVGVGPRRRGISVTKTITVEAPVKDVFAVFCAFDNFPKFMRHVREVKHLDGNRWHWKMEGPGGFAFEWDTLVTEKVDCKSVAWTSTEAASVHNRGEARFEPIGDAATRLTISIEYAPPLGAIGHTVAKLFGADPKRELDEDLLRFKSLLEKGKATGREGPVTRDEVMGNDGGATKPTPY